MLGSVDAGRLIDSDVLPVHRRRLLIPNLAGLVRNRNCLDVMKFTPVIAIEGNIWTVEHD